MVWSDSVVVLAPRLDLLPSIVEASANSPAAFCFLFKSLGPTRVNGVSESVEVFAATGLGPLRTRRPRPVTFAGVGQGHVNTSSISPYSSFDPRESDVSLLGRSRVSGSSFAFERHVLEPP